MEEATPNDPATQTSPITQPAQQPATGTNAPAAATTTNPGRPPNPKKKRAENANGPRRTSRAWEYFNPLPLNDPNDKPQAACKHCHVKFYCGTKSHGTSNMINHIDKCPNNPLNSLKDPTQTTLAFTSGEGSSSLAAASMRLNVAACRKALAMFVILDEQPFRIVEGEGFKNLCRHFQPQFSIPSRRTVARDCLQIFLDEKTKLKALFKSDCSRVALTTDCWTSVQNLNYLTLTAHFIDNDWQYQKRIISFSVIANHKGETVGRKVEEVLRDWGLKIVSTITVDNASSNDVAVSYLKKKLKNTVMGGQFLHLRCCAHILNLVVVEGLKDHHISIDSVRNAVRYVRSSPHRTVKFKECVVLAGITCRKLLCLDVSTRWNSTYLMLDAAEKYQLAFERLEEEDSSFREFFGDAGPPSSYDWENVRAFVKFLKFFYDATKLLSSSQQVSLHSVFHQLSAIHCELKQSSLNLNTVLATMAMDMQTKYDKYWGSAANMNQLLYFGVIFDPRYKMRYIKWSFEGMYADNTEFAADLLKKIDGNLAKMFNWYKQSVEQPNMSLASSSSHSGAVFQSQIAQAVDVMSQFGRTDAFKKHMREMDSIDRKNELEKYLDEENHNGEDKFDLLLWWKQNSARFPILSKMVRDLFATPVSTVASESAFSTGGRVLETFRSSLNPEMAEALICAQNWIKPSVFEIKNLNLSEEIELSELTITDYHGGSSSSGGNGGAASARGAAESQPPGCV